MYLSRDGYKKSIRASAVKEDIVQSVRKDKYLDKTETASVRARLSHITGGGKKSEEVKLLENIVRRLNEE